MSATAVLGPSALSFTSNGVDNIAQLLVDLSKVTFNGVSNAAVTLSNVATPTSASDVATKAYVDNFATATIDAKAAVVAATTADGTLATAFTAGSDIDGVTLGLDDRILLRAQADPIQNGIYIVTNGTPTRALDFASGSNAGSKYVFVQEGNTWADTGFICTNNRGNDIIGTDELYWTVFSVNNGSAGDGLQRINNVFSVDSTVARTNVDNNFSGPQTIANVQIGGLTSNSISTTSGALIIQPASTELTNFTGLGGVRVRSLALCESDVASVRGVSNARVDLNNSVYVYANNGLVELNETNATEMRLRTTNAPMVLQAQGNGTMSLLTANQNISLSAGSGKVDIPGTGGCSVRGLDFGVSGARTISSSGTMNINANGLNINPTGGATIESTGINAQIRVTADNLLFQGLASLNLNNAINIQSQTGVIESFDLATELRLRGGTNHNVTVESQGTGTVTLLSNNNAISLDAGTALVSANGTGGFQSRNIQLGTAGTNTISTSTGSLTVSPASNALVNFPNSAGVQIQSLQLGVNAGDDISVTSGNPLYLNGSVRFGRENGLIDLYELVATEMRLRTSNRPIVVQARGAGTVTLQTDNQPLYFSSGTESAEFTGRGLLLSTTTAPVVTTSKLYNVSGDLYWNAQKLNNQVTTGTLNEITYYSSTGAVASATGVTYAGSGSVSMTGTCTAQTVTATSDQRLKTDFVPLSSVLSKVSRLGGYSYKWKETGEESVGVIAQEVETEYPALVKQGDDGFKSVNYNGLTAVLLQAVNELSDQLKSAFVLIDELKRKLDAKPSLPIVVEGFEVPASVPTLQSNPFGRIRGRPGRQRTA